MYSHSASKRNMQWVTGLAIASYDQSHRQTCSWDNTELTVMWTKHTHTHQDKRQDRFTCHITTWRGIYSLAGCIDSISVAVCVSQRGPNHGIRTFVSPHSAPDISNQRQIPPSCISSETFLPDGSCATQPMGCLLLWVHMIWQIPWKMFENGGQTPFLSVPSPHGLPVHATEQSCLKMEEIWGQ